MRSKKQIWIWNKSTTHHILWKGSWWSDNKVNKTTLPRDLHRHWHSVFKILPPHQIIEFVIRKGCQCMKEDIKNELLAILDKYKAEEMYKPWTIKNLEKFKKSVFSNLYIKN
jgi:hypothetical protein